MRYCLHGIRSRNTEGVYRFAVKVYRFRFTVYGFKGEGNRPRAAI